MGICYIITLRESTHWHCRRSAFSQRRSPRGASVHPLQGQRARGRPGARCTRGLACKCTEENAHEHTGSAEAIRPSLRSGFTAYFALSAVNGLVKCNGTFDSAKIASNVSPKRGQLQNRKRPLCSLRSKEIVGRI